MSQFEKLLAAIRNNTRSVKYRDASKVAEHYFGKPRVRGSHSVYTMPWAGFPRVNLQNVGGYVDSYQIAQLLDAIDKLEGEMGANSNAEEMRGGGDQA